MSESDSGQPLPRVVLIQEGTWAISAEQMASKAINCLRGGWGRRDKLYLNSEIRNDLLYISNLTSRRAGNIGKHRDTWSAVTLWQSVHWSLSTSSLSPPTHTVHMLPTLKGDNPVLFSNCDCLKSQISGWSHIIFILSRCYYFGSWSLWMKYSKMSVLLLVRCIYFLSGDEIEATKDTNLIGREEEWYGGVSAPWRLWNHPGQKL